MGLHAFVDTNYDFFGKRWLFVGISGAVLAACGFSMATRGFNWGVEFTGGAQIEANFDESKVKPTIEEVRSVVEGMEGSQVVTVGSPGDHAFLVRVRTLTRGGEKLGDEIKALLVEKYGEDKVTYYTFDTQTRDSALVRVEDPSVRGADVKQLLESSEKLGGLRVEEVRTEKDSGMMTIVLENASRDVINGLDTKFGKGSYEASIDAIGAAVSRDLLYNAIWAIAISCILIALYVWLRFDVEFAPGVIGALLHDAVVVIGFWSILQFEFNLTFIAAVLAILGYSVNDTVVIYDRIRENLNKFGGKETNWVINKSVNETLSRTILTSGATLLSVIAIAVFGSQSIKYFGVAMIIGLLSGTWSTIAIATPVTFWVYQLRERQKKLATSTPARSA